MTSEPGNVRYRLDRITREDFLHLFDDAVNSVRLDREEAYSNMMLARTIAAHGTIPRARMPVLAEMDLDRLRELGNVGNILQVCDQKKIRAFAFQPLQSDIYVDKCMPYLEKENRASDYPYSPADPLFATNVQEIIDGHHRWLTVMIYNPSRLINTHQLNADKLDAIFSITCAITREKKREFNKTPELK